MKNLRTSLIAAAALSALAGSAFAAQDSATVNASIIQPISITKNTNVSFGTVARPNTVSTSAVTLNPATGTNPVSITGGTALVVTQGTRGQFTITGDGGRAYTLGGVGAFNLTDGTNDISFTPAFAVDSGSLTGTAGALPGTAFTQGTQLLYAGGTFNITDTTVPGAYAGTLTVTVNYN